MTQITPLQQSLWQLTNVFGNLFVVIFAEAKFVDNQVHEYFVFAGLLAIATVVFGTLGYWYKHIDHNKKQDETTPVS
jgi:hypothetical protein